MQALHLRMTQQVTRLQKRITGKVLHPLQKRSLDQEICRVCAGRRHNKDNCEKKTNEDADHHGRVRQTSKLKEPNYVSKDSL